MVSSTHIISLISSSFMSCTTSTRSIHILTLKPLLFFLNTGLKNWCARPNRCIDLTTGGKISGTGGCPVVVQNNPGTPSVGGGSTTIRSGGGSSTTVPSGGSSTTMRSNGGQTTISNQPSSSTSLNGASSIARPGNGTPTVVRGGGGGSTTIPSRIGKATFRLSCKGNQS